MLSTEYDLMEKKIIYFENRAVSNEIQTRLKNMKEFSDRDYYSNSVREHIVNNLSLDIEYWKKFKKEIFRKIRDNCYVIIKGLPFDKNNRLVIGLASILGTPIEPYQRPDTHMVREQTPGEVIYDQDIFPHTDGAHWITVNDLTALQCVRKDQTGGGLSRIVPVQAVIEYMQKEGMQDIINNLYETKYPFKLAKDFGDDGFHYQPILTKTSSTYHDNPHVRFALRYIEECINKFKIDFDSKLIENAQVLEKTVTNLRLKTQFSLNEGDWLIFDNKRVLHSRTSAPKDSKRMLKKIKIDLDRAQIFKI